jgi:flavin prenyltransferase
MPTVNNPAGPENLTVATTGASGSLFLRQLLLTLARDRRVKTVNFIASDNALRVLAEELSIRGRSRLAPTWPAAPIPLTA